MADQRPKITSSGSSHGGKRRASGISSDASKSTIQPPPHHVAPGQEVHGMFQVPPVLGHLMSATYPPKVAIPRLRRESDSNSATGPSRSGDKHRISHACEPCRNRKTKCSGERPACRHCEDFRIKCVYADGKRDKAKKEYNNMAERIEEYEKLLKQLSFRSDASDRTMIQKALHKEPPSEDDDDLLSPSGSARPSRSRTKSIEGEGQVSARVGSVSSIDKISEDYNRSPNSRATGFIGKNSELSWMHRLRDGIGMWSESVSDGGEGWSGGHYENQAPRNRNLDHQNRELREGASLGDLGGVSDYTYHCDDLPLLLPDQVAVRELPPRKTALCLLEAYMETVHPAFPIIGKITFESQAHALLSGVQMDPGPNWLAILNLVFAIAAKYSHFVEAEWRGDERDHEVYFTRARMLGMNSDGIFDHPDLQRVQISGLMAFYLSSIDQINRAWAINGAAIRQCQALGLHLRNETKQVSPSSREIRYRVWWALYGLERHLGLLTGRPTSIADRDCTAPLPSPFNEETFTSAPPDGEAIALISRIPSQESATTPSSPSSTPSAQVKSSTVTSPTPVRSASESMKNVPPSNSLFFYYYTQLTMLSHEVMNTLYSPHALKRSWAETQTTMGTLNKMVDNWRASLPPVLDFTAQEQSQLYRQRLALAFYHQSTRIIIHRPCLCRLDTKIPNESSSSKEFNQIAATKCVHAALGMIDFLPSEPNPIGLYQHVPWWSILHYMMQATTILMMELSYGAYHMPNEAEKIFNSAKKAVYWFYRMAEKSIAVSRAWRLSNEMLRKVAPKIGRHVDDMPSNPPPLIPSYLDELSHSARVMQGPAGLGRLPRFPRQSSGQSSYGQPSHSEDYAGFNPMFHSSYDQFAPFRGQADISNFFPSSTQMDSMARVVEDPTNTQQIFYPLDAQWSQNQQPR